MVENDQYFAGYDFKLPKPWSNTLGYILEEDGSRTQIEMKQKPSSSSTTAFKEQMEGYATVVESEQGVDFDKVIADFTHVCNKIGEDLGNIYPEKLEIAIVPREELRPKSEEQRQYLIKKYGSRGANGGIADFHYRSDGTGVIRLGMLEKEHLTHEFDVKMRLAHELGHGIGGQRIKDPRLEEMKPYSFMQLYRRYEENMDIVEEITRPLNPESIHDIAHFRVIQLIVDGTTEEAILAHLTGMQVGSYRPDSWKEFKKLPNLTNKINPRRIPYKATTNI